MSTSKYPRGTRCTDEEMRSIECLTKQIHDITTDDKLNEEMTVQLTDRLASIVSPIILQGAVRAIRKTLESSRPRTILNSLSLAETVVDKCDRAVHREVATKRFMDQLQKVYMIYHERGDRDSVEIAERVLKIVQSWSETNRNNLPLFDEIYHSMRKKGVEFRDKPSKIEKGSSHFDEFASMDLDEFYCIAQNTVEMLEDLLEAAEEDINLEEHDVMRELVKQGQRMERKLTSIIDENNESASSVRKKTRQRQPTNTMDFLNKAKELDKKHDLQAKAKVGMEKAKEFDEKYELQKKAKDFFNKDAKK